MKIKSKIINANAGSGKTYAIIQRIKEIINAGYGSASVLCITFTKSGVSEMQERLDMEKVDSGGVKIITFHALCQEIVSMFSYELGMPYQFENMERIDEDFLESVQVKVLSLQKIKDLVVRFGLSYGDVQGLCEDLLWQGYNISAHSEVRQNILTDLFDIGEHNIDALRVEIYAEVLNNVPFDILTNIKGKGIADSLPLIMDLLKKCDGVWNRECFEEYVKLVSGLRNKELAEYKNYLKAKQERLKTLEQYEVSRVINECFDEISLMFEREKYDRAKYLFEDIVQKALWIFRNQELRDFALFKFGSTYKHILVDEAQDTNQGQWEVVKYLMEENVATGMSDGSLFIVGDIKQTIYGFQGAEAGIMNDVYLRYKNYLAEEYLTVSYRTTKPVLDVINGAFDVSVKQKHISAFKDDVGAVKIVVATVKPETAEDRVLEFEDIAILIATDVGALLKQNLLHEKHRGRKIEPKDIVILARDRNDKTITALRQAFYNANIPIAFNEKINYKKYNAILDFIALLKLCVIEDDTKSAYGVLAGPIFGIEESELSEFFYKGVKIEDILSRYTSLNDLIALLSNVLFCEGLTAFFYEIYTRYKADYTKQDAEVLAKFIENTNKVKQFEFVQYIQNFEKAEQVLVNKPQGENSVTFTTAHSSKGLQYPVVFFLETAKPQIGRSDSKVLVYNGAIIWNNNKNDRSEIVDKIIQNKIEAMHEEEFRLQYVAMSRAEERFVYVGNNYNTRRTEDGELQNPNSMFHKLQKAMTSEFVHTKEGRFEIDELIRETF